MTDLCVSPKEPSLSAEEQVTLTKQAPTDMVYKILDTKKEGRRKTTERPLYRCRICKKFSKGKNSLHRHYCYAHYKKDLLELIGDHKERCQFCDLKFQSPHDAVSHVGVVHKKLFNFLPKRYQIMSSVGRQTGLTSSLNSNGGCIFKRTMSLIKLYPV